MQRPAELFEMPEFGEGNMFFTLKDITYSPEAPRKSVPFTVKGKVELFTIPFLAPIWVIAKVTYPEKWWEEIIPIIGSPTVGEGQMALGGDFEITFPKGFDREGEFLLEVEAHAGPTYTIDKITLPPFPPMAKEETTFMVSGEVPPEEAGFRNFRILSYSKNGGPPVTPPGVLELDIGDRCRVNVGFDHRDGAVTGKYHAAIWQDRPWDPHDEILNAEKTFSVPSSVDWEPVEDSINIPITSAISPGTEYGLYVKIMGITGGDIFTEYLANVITIVGVPPEEADIKDIDFKLAKGSYDIGAKVPFTCPYDYKGIAQDGQLTISIGTGIYPTFNTVYTYEPIPVEFPAAGDWETRGLEGTIELPDVLEYGRTYSVRAKLETLTIRTQETDTDWSAFDITRMETLEVDITPSGSGYVTTSPAPDIGENHFVNGSTGQFKYGTEVQVTAHPNAGYKFDHWSDEIRGGTSTNNPEWLSGPMTEHRAVKAHFREIEVETRTLEIDITEPHMGYVTTDPPPLDIENHWKDGDRGKFVKDTRVQVTAHPHAGYRFDHWSDEIQGGTSTNNPEWVSDNGYMVDNKAVKAHFREEVAPPPPEEYTLTTEVRPPDAADAGCIVVKDPDKPSYDEGEEVTIWAEGPYSFDHWSGDAVGTWSPYTLVMNYDKHVVAWFKVPGEYTLDVRLSHDVGYVTVSPDKATYSPGEKVTLTAYLDPGQEAYWYLDHWTVNGVARAGNPITITMDEDKVVVANFIYIGPF